MTLKSMTIVFLIPSFELGLVMMFFHIDSIRGFKTSFYTWVFATLFVMVLVVRGGGDNKGEEKLLIINKVQKKNTMMFLQ